MKIALIIRLTISISECIFQLLHQLTDLQYNYNVYFDIKDTCSTKKLDNLKDII